MPKTTTKTKVNVTALVGVIFAGAFMLAAAGFGFLKTEIEPTIQDNLSGWKWNILFPENYNFDPEKIEITDAKAKLKENQEQGTISNIYPLSYACYPNPAVGFLADIEGDIKFQISKDNLNWYYWNNNEWQNAQNIEQNNTASEIDKHIRDFWPRSLNQFYFKAFLSSTEDRLKAVEISCDQSTIDKVKLYPKSL